MNRTVSSALSWVYLIALYGFIFLPVAVLVLFSFQDGRLPVPPFNGFSTQWYAAVFADRKLMAALTNSLMVAALSSAVACLLGAALHVPTWGHGDVTPQAVDTSSLPKLGDDWRGENPFRKNDAAVKVGTSAYNQNCARCHGLEAISGGIAPDLRRLDNDCVAYKDPAKRDACVAENDQYFLTTIRHGRARNGAVYMPPFEGTLNQEAMWAIKSYLETRREKPL